MMAWFSCLYFQETRRWRSHLVDVSLHLIGGHADAVVADGERFGFAIHTLIRIAHHPLQCNRRHRHAALADGVNAIANQLQKHLMAGINGLLDDRENVFGVDWSTLFLQHRHLCEKPVLETGLPGLGGCFRVSPTPMSLVQLGASSAGRGALQRRWPLNGTHLQADTAIDAGARIDPVEVMPFLFMLPCRYRPQGSMCLSTVPRKRQTME